MKYKITKIHPDDAYYVNRDSIIGALVEFVGIGLDEPKKSEDGWISGLLKYVGRKKIKFQFQGEDVEYRKGFAFFFYKVQIEEVK